MAHLKRSLLAVSILVLLVASFAEAQRKPKKTAKSAAPPAVLKEGPAPKFGFIVEIGADKKLTIRVTGEHGIEPDAETLFELMADGRLVRDLDENPKWPMVSVRPAASLDMSTIVDVLKPARVRGQVRLDLPDDISLHVSAPVREGYADLDVKPNPLRLFVELDERGKLTLNNEDAGTLGAPTPLTSRLRDIFKEREKNGVFRERSYDVEKTVEIVMPAKSLLADLIKVAKALNTATAGPIVLQLDPDPMLDPIELDLILKPPVLPKRRP